MNNLPPDSSAHTLQQRIAALAPWYHNLEIAPGIWTGNRGINMDNPHMQHYPQSRWEVLKIVLKRVYPDMDFNDPVVLKGKTVLDVGCNSGFFSRELAKLGADCTGIEVVPRLIEQAQLTRECFQRQPEYAGLDYALHSLSVYDIAQLDRMFDIVLFMGVLYHLRYPLLALDKLRAVCKEWMFLQSEIILDSRLDNRADNDKYVPDANGYIHREKRHVLPTIPNFPALYMIAPPHTYGEHHGTYLFFPNPSGLRSLAETAGFICESFMDMNTDVDVDVEGNANMDTDMGINTDSDKPENKITVNEPDNYLICYSKKKITASP